MRAFNELNIGYLITSGFSEAELREFLEIENQDMISSGGDDQGIDVEAELKKILERKALYDQNHNITFKLQGQYSSRTASLNGEPLTPEESRKLKNHSPDGFNWHYGGSGPAQFALAICAKLLGPDKALEVYQDFKFRVIANLPEADFDVTINMSTEGNTITSTHVTDNIR